MNFDQSILELIKRRFSCRTYQDRPLDPKIREKLNHFTHSLPPGPFQNKVQFQLIAAQPEDTTALSGLGTYGFIKNPAGFILGKTNEEQGRLEDYGYLLESIILRATDLDVGSCWLGGTFNRSRFAQEMDLGSGEIIPAVASLGLIAESPRRIDQTLRNAAGSDQRLPWNQLFFQGDFNHPLPREATGDYQRPLEMVRLGPSASNKQPWRIVRGQAAWHFFLQRTPGYPSQIFGLLLKLADLQRVDLGIALAHFELTCRELELSGVWVLQDPVIQPPTEDSEYVISWKSFSG